jgi:hypothetical protein
MSVHDVHFRRANKTRELKCASHICRIAERYLVELDVVFGQQLGECASWPSGEVKLVASLDQRTGKVSDVKFPSANVIGRTHLQNLQAPGFVH